jgi:hypothetical protein
MPRLELQLFLWVTAFGLVAFGLLHGSSSVSPVLFDEVEGDSASTVSVAYDRMPIALALATDSSANDSFLESNSRPIFVVPAPVPALPDGDLAATQTRALPILKGIVSSGKELRAVFASSPDAYVVVAPGEQISEYTVTSISTEQVLARDPLGVSHTFALRGTGEN